MDEIKEFVDSYKFDEEKTNIDLGSVLTDEICNSPITMVEIKTHLHKLRSHKAVGADVICGEFLKYVCDDICPTLYIG